MTMLRKLSCMSALALVLSVSAFPALAAEGGEAKAGLPQLDIAQFPAQLFWLALTFATLYVLMARIALPSVKSTLDKRGHILSQDLSAASKANDDAKAMIAAYEQALADARHKAQAMFTEISTAAAKESSERLATQQRELTQRLGDAESKITAARDAAIASLNSTASDLAASVVEKVSGLKGVSHG